jgi:hypothetical protein
MKKTLSILSIVFACISLVACGNNYQRNDVDRYVQGDKPHSTILSKPKTEDAKVLIETYILCSEMGQMERYDVDRSSWYEEPRDPKVEMLGREDAVCGSRLKTLILTEAAMKIVREIAQGERGQSAEGRLKSIQEMLENLKNNK